MECLQENNIRHCNCSYGSCERKGKCCLCISYHRKSRELPACFFYDDYERTYDRSLDNFLKMVGKVGMRTE
ncbi:hypothetical protein BMS3Abin07_00411 [bacterium BMS3Abin07]|nr:hypothetical protein BMS3Abin07_00411 [bacterium BMS3Abin07]GBE32778.1 hypothetical protein BMS3Bbin05_01697 [bacterium BMS3Bbin05]HDO21569.1 cytosolic protein [Nitrospirota bacterium]HDZ87241.1 cytosolic protein [Nitrospirota bacterium]